MMLVGRSTAKAKAAAEIVFIDAVLADSKAGLTHSIIFRVGLLGIVIATLGDRLEITVGVGVNVRDEIIGHIDVTGPRMPSLVDDEAEGRSVVGFAYPRLAALASLRSKGSGADYIEPLVLGRRAREAEFHRRSAVDLARRNVEVGLAFTGRITGRVLEAEVTSTILEIGVAIFPVHTYITLLTNDQYTMVVVRMCLCV